MLRFEDFFPKYPYLDDEDRWDPYRNFNQAIANKKEFMLPMNDSFSHQKVIERFMSPFTPYNELLLFHEMGTGKTCTSVQVIEQLKNANTVAQAIICAKGSGLIKNYIQELLFTCTSGQYIPANYDQLSDLEKTRRISKKLAPFYTFYTFEIFAKVLLKMTDASIVKKFSRTVFVIDEVHHLRSKEDMKESSLDYTIIYQQFHRVFHLVKESKILLLSGTMMKDGPSEFATIMNLILPLDQQLPLDSAFIKEYFINDQLIPNKVSKLKNIVKGRLSYLKSVISNILKEFKGQAISKLKHFIVFPLTMSEFQSVHYDAAYQSDKEKKSIFNLARQAALFVYPNGVSGSLGFDTYVKTTKKGHQLSIPFMTETRLNKATTNDQRLAIIQKYSCKFAQAIELILDSPTTLVYCEYVNGSGCILFCKLLELFGYSPASGVDSVMKKRFILLTHQTASYTKMSQLIQRFNKPDNLDGQYISVVVGSRTISEGFTFKNVRREIIMTPHWNYSETSQVIARGWRFGSHQDLLARGDQNIKVEIFQQVALPQSKSISPSIDLDMYTISEKKDIIIKQIEYIIKQSAWDCNFMKPRNSIQGYDRERECDYQLCQYRCDTPTTKIDDITYNLYYTETETLTRLLQTYFLNHFYIHVDEIQTLAPSLSMYEILVTIYTLIHKNTRFHNKYGHLSFVRHQGNTLYLTSNARVLNNDEFSQFYSKQIILENGDSFEDILSRLQFSRLPTLIDTFFSQNVFTRSSLLDLPQEVQLLILQASIEANEKKIKKKAALRQEILAYFKGFYDKINGSWTIWLYQNNLGVWSYRAPLTWVRVQDESIIHQYKFRLQEKLTQSPVDFYGQYNPILDEFCLRRVDPRGESQDLRKIKVGKRCINWDMPTLVDLIVRRIKLKPPQPWNGDRAQLEFMVKNNKYMQQADLSSVDKMDRLNYWSNKTRQEICKAIFDWFTKMNLIEKNLNCGTQKKKRA